MSLFARQDIGGYWLVFRPGKAGKYVADTLIGYVTFSLNAFLIGHDNTVPMKMLDGGRQCKTLDEAITWIEANAK